MTAIAACSAIGGGKAKVYTRNGLDWTDKFPEIAEAAARLEVGLGPARRRDRQPRRQGQYRLLGAPAGDQRGRPRPHPVPVRRARDRRRGPDPAAPPSSARRASPRWSATAGRPLILYADHIVGQGEKLFDAMCEAGQEGIISKRADAPYRGGRTQELAQDQMHLPPGIRHHRLDGERQEGPRLPRRCCSASTKAASFATPARSAPASRST